MSRPPPISVIRARRRLPFLSLLIAALLFAGFWFFGRQLLPFLSKSSSLSSLSSPAVKTSRQWPSCRDPRQVLESSDLLYIACEGGVLITNPQGVIQNQITVSTGLTHPQVTSLVAKGDNLYIGTENGLVIFNLTSRTSTHLGVPDGLTSGTDLTLFADGQYIWIGTYNGLNRLDTQTGQLNIYTHELASGGSAYTISQITATPKAVYVLLSHSSISSGGVARFDKINQTWDTTSASNFASPPQELVVFSDKVWLSDSSHIWEATDASPLAWTEVTSRYSSNLPPPPWSFNWDTSGTVYVRTTSALHKIFHTNQVSQFASGVFGKPLFAQPKLASFWFSGPAWLTQVSAAGKSSSITLQNRPLAFQSLLAAIDGRIVAVADDKIVISDSSGSNFTSLFPSDHLAARASSDTVFYPIPTTSDVFIASPTVIGVYDYASKDFHPLSPPDYLTNYKFAGFDSASGQLLFRLPDSAAILSAATWTWSQSPLGILASVASNCNPGFTFSTSGDRFSQLGCSDISPRLQNNPSGRQGLYEIDSTGKSTLLSLPAAGNDYSSLGWNKGIQVNKLLHDGPVYWIATSTGLVKYTSSPYSMRLLTTQNGLVSNDVTDILVTEDFLWAISRSAGLSRIPL